MSTTVQFSNKAHIVHVMQLTFLFTFFIYLNQHPFFI